MGSIPPAASIEYPQREIVSLITHAGLAPPDDADLSQLARSVQSMLMNSQDDAGTANAYQVTMHPAPNAYYKYLMVILKVGNDNTGPSVLNVNALGPKPIVHIDGTALDAGNMKANAIVCLMYDGAAFQMVWSSGGVAGVPGAPVFLTAPRTLYVNWATGNDATMDGTTAAAVAGTIHGPFKTPQRATDEINKYNLNGFNVQVYLADSLNYPSFALPRPSGSGNVGWQGNLATPSACVITGVNITAISASNCGQQIIAGMKVTASGNPNIVPDPICGIYISGGGSGVVVQDIEYGNCLGMQLVCARSAVVTMLGKQIITGNSPGSSFFNGGFVQAFALGFIQTGVNQPVFSAPAGPVTIPIFASASTGGNIGMSFQSIANAGNIIGKKYDVSFNACIVNGNGINYYPGTIAGTTSTGGQYA
ncbi:hypothetical protein ACVJ5M_003836 [Bradyrhizobium sp. S3.7.6]